MIESMPNLQNQPKPWTRKKNKQKKIEATQEIGGLLTEENTFR